MYFGLFSFNFFLCGDDTRCGDDTTFLAFRHVSETFLRLHVRNQFVVKANAFAIAEIPIRAMTAL